MQNYKFNIDFMQHLLDKIKKESNRTILAVTLTWTKLNIRPENWSNSILLPNNFMPQITLSTRVAQKSAALLDNMLINRHEYKCTCSNIKRFISDHFSQFIIFKKFKRKITSRKMTAKSNSEISSFSIWTPLN